MFTTLWAIVKYAWQDVANTQPSQADRDLCILSNHPIPSLVFLLVFHPVRSYRDALLDVERERCVCVDTHIPPDVKAVRGPRKHVVLRSHVCCPLDTEHVLAILYSSPCSRSSSRCGKRFSPRHHANHMGRHTCFGHVSSCGRIHRKPSVKS
jgi:hypothetical protein